MLRAGLSLWKRYFLITDAYNIRKELKLNRPDVGWYQVRKALERREEDRTQIDVDFAIFESTYEALTAKLAPEVYDLGFLKI